MWIVHELCAFTWKYLFLIKLSFQRNIYIIFKYGDYQDNNREKCFAKLLMLSYDGGILHCILYCLKIISFTEISFEKHTDILDTFFLFIESSDLNQNRRDCCIVLSQSNNHGNKVAAHHSASGNQSSVPLPLTQYEARLTQACHQSLSTKKLVVHRHLQLYVVLDCNQSPKAKPHD